MGSVKFFFLCVALFSASCGKGEKAVSEKPPDRNEKAVVETGAIDFSLKTLDGETIALSDYRGKTVVINFWATWCKPCLIEMPDFNEVYNERKTELIVIGITLESGEADQVRPFVDEMNLDYPIVMGDETVRTVFGEIVAFPTTFIVDGTGRIVEKYIGTMSRKKLETLIGQAG